MLSIGGDDLEKSTIFGGCRIIGGDTSLHGFAHMVMKRFEIIEKLNLCKALLKMAGGGMHLPPRSALAGIYTLVQINLNTCKKESIFESFCFILKITKVPAVPEIP